MAGGGTKALNPGVALEEGKRLGPVITLLREKKDMVPAALAGLAGVDEKTVRNWESGRSIISNESLPRVARVLETKCSAMWAMAGN
jgi:transcriptional regulator with XRE-family HTH domain